MKRPRRIDNLPEKANKILNGILIVLLLITIKIWHLAVIQHEKKQEESKKPQRRVVIERSERATICDRFNIPLATNKVQYNAAISYGPIRDLPRSIWKKNEEGKRVKCAYRKEYITHLSKKMGEELNLDSEWIEDIIHSKGAILGNVPCVIKQNITETQYFRLKMLEKDWPGVLAEIGAKRCYPLGPIGGEVIGYIGPISRKEYDAITLEMSMLREAISAFEEEGKEIHLEGYGSVEQIAARLEELEKKAYHINDFVGKSGVEASFDEQLRGMSGKKVYLTDTKGNFLKELENSDTSRSGQQLVLSISAELQEFAQKLLVEYENEPASAVPLSMRPLIPDKQPWIKGGAIVAMDPNNGQIYALASFPTFEPNDFIRSGALEQNVEKNIRVNQWLETDTYLASLWNMKVPYVRQKFDGDYYEEAKELNWDTYLSMILPAESKVKQILEKKSLLKDALFVQKKLDQLVHLFQSDTLTLSAAKILDLCYRDPEDAPLQITITLPEKEFFEERQKEVKEGIARIKQQLAPWFSQGLSNYEKILVIDLYRLCVDASLFTPELAKITSGMPLQEYREATARYVSVREAVKEIVREIFCEQDFKKWREEHFKDYLAQKRKEEKESGKKYARPFIEYLEIACKDQFQAFWEENQWDLLAFFLSEMHQSPNQIDPYIQALGHWTKELKGGAHSGLEWVSHYKALRKVSDYFDPINLLSFLKTLRSYEQLTRPLIGRYLTLRGGKEKDLASGFYPAYGFGFARSHAFRQAATIGSIFKLVPAYEALRQRYLTLKERKEALLDLNPLTIIDDKHRIFGKIERWNVGFALDGKAIPMYYRGGRLPRSEHSGVGKVDIIRALEASSNPYFAMLSGDVLEDPEDLCHAANLLGFGEKSGIDLPGEYAGRLPRDVAYNRTGLYAMSIGQHSLVGTPLQTAVLLSLIANGGHVLKPQMTLDATCEERWNVFMPTQIQNVLLTAMKQVIMGDKGTARVIRKKQFDASVVNQMIGKTSTSEVIERMSLDEKNGQMKLKHVWFGSISYESNDFSKPELIVIVYLRYGGWGKDAAPLAVEMVKKWREIKKKYS